MPSDYFACETPLGASRYGIPKLAVGKAGTVQVWRGLEMQVGAGWGEDEGP